MPLAIPPTKPVTRSNKYTLPFKYSNSAIRFPKIKSFPDPKIKLRTVHRMNIAKNGTKKTANRFSGNINPVKAPAIITEYQSKNKDRI